jgi:hypothetical protein
MDLFIHKPCEDSGLRRTKLGKHKNWITSLRTGFLNGLCVNHCTSDVKRNISVLLLTMCNRHSILANQITVVHGWIGMELTPLLLLFNLPHFIRLDQGQYTQ